MPRCCADDFSCALFHHGFLRQGTLTITQRHVCFASVFVRGTSNLVLPFMQIEDVQRRSSFLFPIGLALKVWAFDVVALLPSGFLTGWIECKVVALVLPSFYSPGAQKLSGSRCDVSMDV